VAIAASMRGGEQKCGQRGCDADLSLHLYRAAEVRSVAENACEIGHGVRMEV
jgi:hypothetical protein